MSGLVEKVKQRVRSRSKSRRSLDANRSSFSHDGHPEDNNVPAIPSRPSTDRPLNTSASRQGLSSYKYDQSNLNGSTPSSPTSPISRKPIGANHQSSPSLDGVGRPLSSESSPRESLSDRVSSALRTQIPQTTSNREMLRGSAMNESGLSTAPATSNRRGSRTLAGSHPDGQDTSLSGMTRTAGRISREEARDGQRDDSVIINRHTPGHKTTHSQDIAPADPSPLIPKFSKMGMNNPNGTNGTSSTVQNAEVVPSTYTSAEEQTAHMRLPYNFEMSKTTRTHVDEYVAPAVTHETIIKQRTEILQEAITRDIHIHHYYTYIQPVKVVEVLPARHFALNTKTGERTEIAAPAGWVMPENMQPRSTDTSQLHWEERHYLVDEAHPRGLPEPAPSAEERERAVDSFVDDRSTSRRV